MFPSIDPYSSHLPLLAAAVSKYSSKLNRIIELGAGQYSTPILRSVCGCIGKQLMTIDNDYSWLLHVMPRGVLESDSINDSFHRCLHIPDWNDLHRYGQELICDVAFVDVAPAELRKTVIEVMRRWANIIVIHDTETEQRHNYPGVNEQIRTFKYQITDRRRGPWTTVVSDSIDVSELSMIL